MIVRIFGFLFGLAVAVASGYWVWQLYEKYLGPQYLAYLREIVPTGPAWWMETGAPIAFVSVGVLAGFLASAALYRILASVPAQIRTVPAALRITGMLGILFGLGLTAIASSLLLNISGGWTLVVIFGICSMYLGWVVATSLATELQFLFPGLRPPEDPKPVRRTKLLDTSVIIDGRIADVCRTRFLEGPLLVPGFVIEELQHIADSPDTLKRNRGRRGLDVLNAMRKDFGDLVTVLDSYPQNLGPGDTVDQKLVRIAKDQGGIIITNDYNLNKVAQLHGVQVLNVNELANALKPVVLPGEVLTVSLMKEGKESEQGVGYLDDGTMVVVEHGRQHLGQTLDVVVSSVLQTVAGKMIFANLSDDPDSGRDRPHGGRGGPRGRER